MYKLGLFFLISLPCAIIAQVSHPLTLSGNKAIAQDFMAPVANPSFISKENLSAGLIFQNRFVPGIKQGGMGLNYMKNRGQLGLSIWQNGTENFNRQILELSAGKQLSETFSMGVSGGVQNYVQGQGYGNISRIIGGVYSQLKPNAQFSAAAYWRTLAPNSIEKISQEMGLAANYHASENVVVTGSMALLNGGEPVMGLALWYSYQKKIVAQVVANSSAEPLLINLSFTKAAWKPLLQYRFHSQLGSSYSIGVQWAR